MDMIVGRETSIQKVAFASFVGTAIEYYDFYVYATAAALVFPALFFPGFSPLAGTLAAFATFAVGFVARPLGGILFGHFGDRVGRKAMLVVSLLTVGISTFLVGLVPTYATVGVAAPVLLVALRFLQGVGFGGEWGGAVLMSAEHAPENRRGFFSSWVQMGAPVGFLLSSGAFLLMTLTLSEPQFASWGWRVPFLLSIALVVIGLYVRSRVAETPAFKRVIETHTVSRVPILDAAREHPKSLALTAGTITFTGGLFFLLAVFALSYGTTQLGVTQSTMLNTIMISNVVLLVGIPLFAALSDRIGRRSLCMAGPVFLGLWAFPLFWLLDTGRPALITLALSVGMFGVSVSYGPLAALFVGLFKTRVRYSGVSMGYNLGAVFGSALAPIIATQLLASTGGSWSISLYVVALALIGFLSIYLMPEDRLEDITATS